MGVSDWNVSRTEYPAVRRVMGSDRMRLDDDALELWLERRFPGASAEEVEDFMGTVQRFGREAAPIAQRVLPGVAQGAVQGGTVAGPWGALAGGVIGGASSLVGGARPPATPPPAAPEPSRAAPSTPGQAPGPAPAAQPAAPAASAPQPPPDAGSAAAASQLIALLSRPETMQALLALVLATGGRPSVPVGAREVPPAAFANAIAELAAAAASDESAFESDAGGHLFDEVGQPRGDIANPAERAAILLADLAYVATEEADATMREAYDADEADDAGSVADERVADEAWDAENDPMDAYDAAVWGSRHV